MKHKLTLLLLAAVSLWLGAADDAAVLPSPGVTAAPTTDKLLTRTDAITIPRMLSYQGKLTDTLGNPVPDGNYQLTFRLYTQETGGTPFWTEAQTLTVKKGYFSALLGAVNPIGSVPDAGVLYLSLQVGVSPELSPRLRIASSAYAYLAGKADTANYALAGGDMTWVRGTPDSVLFTIHQLGIARGGSNNMLYGSNRHTHTNLGVSCTTGTSGQDYSYCTVTGGHDNTASGYCATVGGGQSNTASYDYATVAGGYTNTASGHMATVAGGRANTASGDYATATGYLNTASGNYATVAGVYSTASGNYGTATGYADTSAATSSFTTNNHSVVPSGYYNSAAFNGQTATAANQLRCGALSKASGSFTIDHPLDPYHKILNHYFIEGPEMRNIYEGSVVLDASGRAEVKLPDYFSVLNRNPHIQLTGVGTKEVVYVAEDVKGNRFVIGGPANAKVYWQVTGERQDVSAEATRRMMPVEQPKTGELAGRMLDDDFLAGCMLQLEREGKASGLDFRTAAGRARYEQMKNPPKPEMER
ncbi:MAG: hypothetical protein ABIK39_06175 [candidate division WOR-3 bacterium]